MAPRGERDRRAAERAGRQAERLAALLLMLKGYRILERRYRCAAGEIDLIATRAGLVAFVEVKARADREAARLALTRKGRARIEKAALSWQSKRLGSLETPVRFDLVSVAGGWPRHHKDAWRPGE